MKSSDLEAEQRAREYFHGLTVLRGAWIVIRVDGRSFSKFTAEHFDKPFDASFSQHMTATAAALLEELNGLYAYTESDEISVLLPRSCEMFGRSVKKLVSVSAGIASSSFTESAQLRAHFDSRLWVGASARTFSTTSRGDRQTPHGAASTAGPTGFCVMKG